MLTINEHESAKEIRDNLLTAAEDMATLLAICMDEAQRDPLNEAYISKINASIASLNRLALAVHGSEKAA